jgi:glyoxylase-like metal-dependent hydrolase (beta-lactamase superfamily II)
MASALRELRAHTSTPIVAVFYTHFHYIGGTRAVFEDAGRALPVYGHERTAQNLARRQRDRPGLRPVRLIRARPRP